MRRRDAAQLVLSIDCVDEEPDEYGDFHQKLIIALSVLLANAQICMQVTDIDIRRYLTANAQAVP